jgi:hypothetical protein
MRAAPACNAFEDVGPTSPATSGTTHSTSGRGRADTPWREAAVEEYEVSVRHRASGNVRLDSVERVIEALVEGVRPGAASIRKRASDTTRRGGSAIVR